MLVPEFGIRLADSKDLLESFPRELLPLDLDWWLRLREHQRLRFGLGPLFGFLLILELGGV